MAEEYQMEDDCAGCECEVNGCVWGPGYNSPEGKAKRQVGLSRLRQLTLLQMVLSSISVVLGTASIGVLAVNPSYPQINGYAVAAGIMVLIGSVLGRKASLQPCDDKVSSRVRAYIMVHYVMNITCVTFSILQIVYTSIALGECLSPNHEKCMPYLTANQIIDCTIIVAGIGLLITCSIGVVFFFMYARVLGYNNRFERMRQEIDSLRQEVAAQQNTKGAHVNNTYSSFGSKSVF